MPREKKAPLRGHEIVVRRARQHSQGGSGETKGEHYVGTKKRKGGGGVGRRV